VSSLYAPFTDDFSHYATVIMIQYNLGCLSFPCRIERWIMGPEGTCSEYHFDTCILNATIIVIHCREISSTISSWRHWIVKTMLIKVGRRKMSMYVDR